MSAIPGTFTPAVVGTASPSSGPASSPLNPRGSLDKSAFLRLLVTQMKHQDPLAPTGNDEMAAQLAQFSSLEQLQTMNTTLTGQAGANAALIATIQSSAAIGMLGKTVMASGDAVVLPAGADPTTVPVSFNVRGASGQGTLSIMDAGGSVVGTRPLGLLNAGPLTVDLGAAATGLPEGTYTYAVNVTSPAGTVTPATTYTVAQVDSVQSTASGPVLVSGPLLIPFSSVIAIRN